MRHEKETPYGIALNKRCLGACLVSKRLARGMLYLRHQIIYEMSEMGYVNVFDKDNNCLRFYYVDGKKEADDLAAKIVTSDPFIVDWTYTKRPVSLLCLRKIKEEG